MQLDDRRSKQSKGETSCSIGDVSESYLYTAMCPCMHVSESENSTQTQTNQKSKLLIRHFAACCRDKKSENGVSGVSGGHKKQQRHHTQTRIRGEFPKINKYRYAVVFGTAEFSSLGRARAENRVLVKQAVSSQGGDCMHWGGWRGERAEV